MNKQITLLFILSALFAHAQNKTADNLNRLGITHYDSSNFVAAINCFTKAISLDSTNPEYYSNRALCRYDMKNFGDALTDIDKAIKLKASYPGLYYIRGLIQEKTGEHEQAKKDFTKEIIFNQGCYKCYYNLGNMYADEKENDLALKMYDKAILANIEFKEAWNNRAVLKYRLKDKTGACADWKKAFELGDKEAAKDLSRFCN